MVDSQAVITDFMTAPTQFVSSQMLFMDWIVAAHTQAESIQRRRWSADEQRAFTQELRQRLWHVGCKPETIAQRGHTISDFLHCNWPEMKVYRLNLERAIGIGIQQRQSLHQDIVESFFDHLYQDEINAPTNMIHVSCTGYASPSGAQKMISRKRWEGQSTVTHVYHMGCYGALPAIRIGKAFTHGLSRRTDIVHTELCSLHMNPLNHSASQLISQSLFADGCIKYSIVSEEHMTKFGKGFRIIGQHEHIIPESAQYMQWVIGDAGFHFVLAKEIPVLISRSLPEYLKILCHKSGISSVNELIEQAVFAVHPGGPKILDYVQKAFTLEDHQLQASRHILKQHGNMSSATLPHIWQEILNDTNIKSGTKILSMAFGPGLTIAGALLEKIG